MIKETAGREDFPSFSTLFIFVFMTDHDQRGQSVSYNLIVYPPSTNCHLYILMRIYKKAGREGLSAFYLIHVTDHDQRAKSVSYNLIVYPLFPCAHLYILAY